MTIPKHRECLKNPMQHMMSRIGFASNPAQIQWVKRTGTFPMMYIHIYIQRGVEPTIGVGRQNGW